MPTLASELRNKLERVVIEARDAAEAGARAALQALAVHERDAYPHLKKQPELLQLRNALRARARQLGDRQDASGRIAIDHLAAECAYEHWHRMLFARFLAENGLLIEPQENMAISLAEAEELAKEDGVNVWVFASHCAQRMLPQIFRPEDPLLQVSFATEHMLTLEKLLASLPQVVFTASDALGWVYQFWQSKKKDEVNRSEVKIGADEISAVTQLFTEPYMVEFLLHNTLGAWWAGKKLAVNPKLALEAKSEDELRTAVALPGVGWEYLRFVRGEDGKSGPWRPAAGTFDGWPKTAAQLKMLDPCGGSGHFLVAGLHHLVPIRMAEEGLSAAQAVDAVLRDNLHGLEIDERCCQIAAFALAFAAWRYPDAGGYRPLPDPHIACTGIGPQSTQEQWVKLAEQSGMPTRPDERERIKNGLLNLHRLFSQAPMLGSLINPKQLEGDVFAADYETIQPYLAAILSAEKADDETRERAIAAAGMVKAADLLTGEYTLVITNVPYLTRGKQSDVLSTWCDSYADDAKLDLATVFLCRCLDFLPKGASTGIVVPQNWLALKSFAKLRNRLMTNYQWRVLVKLGPAAFSDMNWWAANTALLVFTNQKSASDSTISGVDASAPRRIPQKQELLQGGSVDLGQSTNSEDTGGNASLNDYASDAHFGTFGQAADGSVHLVNQCQQLLHRGAIVVFGKSAGLPELADFATVHYGFKPGQTVRVTHYFWEHSNVPDSRWQLMESTPGYGLAYSGKSELCMRPDEMRRQGITEFGESGVDAWGHEGVVVAKMGRLPHSIYCGQLFDDNTYVLRAKKRSMLPSIWEYITSGEFFREVRSRNPKVAVDTESMIHIPFDVEEHEARAATRYPSGLPEPESDDPTQWLFHGRPEESTAPLQVAVARLLGYRWPAELDDKMRLSKRARALVKRCGELVEFAADEGIVCIPSVRGKEPAAERLLALLAAALVKPGKVRELAGGADLDDWLRNSFFEEHCKLFHDRPFVWHIWDGRKRDGFHALVNYHKLAEGGGKGRKLLESLTYAYLGEWITRQKDGVKPGEGGAEDRLAAALELQKRLEAILEGEPPFDLFVRWKPLAEQPIGWEPDINDGVRINIRPFLASDLPSGRTGAGVLRWKPNIKWTKDRGKEPDRPKAEYPWFWGWDEKTQNFLGGKTFDGNRWNDCHYTNKAKQAARDAGGKGKS